jgi:hypothetical protein
MIRSSVGTNKLVMKWAGRNWYLVQVWHTAEDYPAKQRNEEMICRADYLVAFTNGKCKSTGKMIRMAQESKVSCKTYAVPEPE